MTESTTETRHTEITRFWRHLFGGQSGLLLVWTGIRDENGDIPNTTIRERFFNYPKAAQSAATWALEKSKDGREVYHCAHLLTASKRKKRNASEVRSLWADLDDADIPNGSLKPSCVVESSPGRYQVYHRLTDAMMPEAAEQLNRRLADRIGADPSGFDLTQILRVPCTTNYKYPGRPTVQIWSLDGGLAYTPAELERLLPPLEDNQHYGHHAPPVEDRIPAGARNKQLTSLAGTMRRRGMGEAEILAALLATNQLRCDPPLPEAEVRTIAASVSRYTPVPRLQTDSSDSSDSFSNTQTFMRTPPFPIDALPSGCARYVREAAASLSCAPELVAIPMIAALSGVIGYSIVIRIKPGWIESASMYLAVVDEPGSRKSPAATLAHRPLEKLQATLRKTYKEEMKTYQGDMRNHAVAKKLAAKEGMPEPEPPVKPVMMRCLVDDITIEALASRLEQNPRGFLSHQDELTGFIRGMDQYKAGGKGNTRQSYLKMWSGRPIYVDRKGSDEPVVVPRPFLTLQGGIQPSVLHEIADGRNDGFLDRFDFAYPEPSQGGYSEETISRAAEIVYENVIGYLWDQSPQEEDEESGELVPRVVRMDKEAKALFVAKATGLSREMAAPGFPTVLRGPWAKFDTKLARLALILTATRAAEEEADDIRVTGEDMQAALRLLSYFKATTRKAYGQLFEADSDDVLATDLLTLLLDSGYVFSGTISHLMDHLDSSALPDTLEALGKAIRRIVKRSPDLSLKSKSTGKERIITITLRKPSELSEPSEPSVGGDDDGPEAPLQAPHHDDWMEI